LLTPVSLFNSTAVGVAPGIDTQRTRAHADYNYLNESLESDLNGLAHNSSMSVPGRRSSHSGIQVVRFHVWQDLTSGVGDGAAPLHATVTFDMTSEWYASLQNPCGTIKIEGLKGEGLIQAKLLINQAHYGLGLSQPGSRQLQFVMSPTPMYVKLDASETVRGTVRMKFGDRQLIIRLPETRVIFTR
jgi:hypothetical protein